MQEVQAQCREWHIRLLLQPLPSILFTAAHDLLLTCAGEWCVLEEQTVVVQDLEQTSRSRLT